MQNCENGELGTPEDAFLGVDWLNDSLENKGFDLESRLINKKFYF
jgi:hypothetical protein